MGSNSSVRDLINLSKDLRSLASSEGDYKMTF